MDLKFYSVCQKSPPTRASSSRCVWGLDRCWHGWRSPGASVQHCRPGVSATTPIQTRRTGREKIRDVIYCWLIGSLLVDWGWLFHSSVILNFCGFYSRCVTVSHCDDVRLTVYQVGLVTEVSPGTIRIFTVTMATLETPTRVRVLQWWNVNVQFYKCTLSAWMCFKQLEKNNMLEVFPLCSCSTYLWAWYPLLSSSLSMTRSLRQYCRAVGNSVLLITLK